MVYVLDINTSLPIDGAQVALTGTREGCSECGGTLVPNIDTDYEGKVSFSLGLNARIDEVIATAFGYIRVKKKYNSEDIMTIYLAPEDWNN
ncbi:hypothetical protein NO995_05310 [Aestuariibaculum sp. M13]|uniref:hypothetical protein n=1 Tax=Aestuariibaculum sp. M13 TaxID=2967132 RepID=UPI002159C98E|nr:hypothetical protein [Aestuariibaculum sp. M13]MCR8667090.1 hypothetical protein [Aestuariibaculum sp. M13]